MGAIILKSHLSYPGGTFLKHILWRHRRDEAYLWDISVLEERTGRLLAGRLLHDEPFMLDNWMACLQKENLSVPALGTNTKPFKTSYLCVHRLRCGCRTIPFLLKVRLKHRTISQIVIRNVNRLKQQHCDQMDVWKRAYMHVNAPLT